MDADLDTPSRPHGRVTIDDWRQQAPQLAPWRPGVGIAPKLSHAELVTWRSGKPCSASPARPAGWALPTGSCASWFPACPASAATTSGGAARPGCWASSSGPWPATRRWGATMSGCWTPPGGGRPLPGDHQALGVGRVGPSWRLGQPFALLWGLGAAAGLHLRGLPVAVARTGATADQRRVLVELLAVEPQLAASPAGAGPGGRQALRRPRVRAGAGRAGSGLVRPARKGEGQRPGARLSEAAGAADRVGHPTVKGQLDLEGHRGRTGLGVAVRVLQRILALTAAIWHNDTTRQPTCGRDRLRPLTPRHQSSSRPASLPVGITDRRPEADSEPLSPGPSWPPPPCCAGRPAPPGSRGS